MFMVQYEPNGLAGPHDHPFEETYLILEGAVEATFDGDAVRARSRATSRGRASAACTFRNVGDGTGALAGDPGARATRPALVPVRPGLGVPATTTRGRRLMRTVVDRRDPGLGLEVARVRAARGDDVVLTGRDAGARRRGCGVDRSRGLGRSASTSTTPDRSAGALAGRRIGRPPGGRRDRARPELRRRLRRRPGHPARRTQAGRLHRGRAHAAAADGRRIASIVLFGGRAKDRPYPGSITVSTVNGGIVGLVNALAAGDGADPRQRAAPGHRR